jgi:YfiH family protein
MDRPMKITNSDGVNYFSVPEWDAKNGVVHGLFTRTGGVSPPPYASLNVGQKGGDTPGNVRNNLERAARALSIPAERIFCASQVHGDRIHQVSGSEASVFGHDDPLQGDGLLTAEGGLYLGILTADCVPLLLLDPGRSVVGAVHAGWRGTAKGIAAKAVRRMRDALGCKASDILVSLGPAIGPCCYVVGDEVATAFVQKDPETGRFLRPEGSGRWKLNLAGINRHQLINAGVQQKNISTSSLCTSCRIDLFFSVRGEGEPTGRQIALIGLRPEQ